MIFDFEQETLQHLTPLTVDLMRKSITHRLQNATSC